VIADINQTDICLIPKVAQPEFVSQFRPISLCNTLYKLISKVVVHRLKECIPIIVSPFQTGFIPGRSIHENIVVAQEIVHSMHKSNGAKGYFAIKVDLAKAYDMLRWDFISHTLQEVGLPMSMINIIMQGVTSVTTNVNWHGARTSYFSPHRGIRQGDPMSPYIFVICMDKLSHLISHAVNQGKWKGIKAGRTGPMISHLMFADDLLLFGEANIEQMNCVMSILNEFCYLSGQKVSIEKTSIMFSKNVKREARDRLQQVSGFRVTPSLGKYLGVPLNGKAPKRVDFQYIISQLQSKLTTWKANNLSFAGRVTLTKSVMEAIPIYPMMTTMIPSSILKEAQRLQRSFIWGDSATSRRYHAVSWDMVTRPKRLGGLGLRKMETMNRACIMKMGWELQHGKNELWSQVMKGKYGRGIMNLANAGAKPTDSSFWKALVSFMPWIHTQTCSAIGDGRGTSAWDMCWIAPGLRIVDLNIDIPANIQHACVNDLVTDNGNWNRELLNWMPNNILNKLIAIPTPEDANGDDLKFWPYSKYGHYSVASAYDLLTDVANVTADATWKKIWSLQIPERIRSFIWLLKHGRLLTNFRKSKMSLGSPFCSFCGDVIETELHVLRDCPSCMNVWLNIVHDNSREAFFNSNLQQWLTMNITGQIVGIDAATWNIYWAVACHSLWTWRNKEIYDDNFHRPIDPRWQVHKRVMEYQGAARTSRLMISPSIPSRQVSWSSLSADNWVVVNTDGAGKPNYNYGCGGLIRNSKGEWISGFAKGLGTCSVVVTELWGAFEGLKLVWEREDTN
jgi:hypothetical protein